MDNLTKTQRSYCMSRIRGIDTKPEMIVRSLVHQIGYRYSLHKQDLPGQPDIVLTRHCKIIFVHGCFWHMHTCRHGKVFPKTHNRYWPSKRQGNLERDRKNIKELKNLGWKVLVIWECQTKDAEKLTQRLSKFLTS
jgi:DNA mismatch endonuclease (patch repair protein)